jgi:hypothetical protein
MEEKARKTASKEMVDYVKKLGREAAQVTTQAVPETTSKTPGDGS